MPRVLTQEELLRRGARFLEPIEEKFDSVEESPALVVPPIIDAKPIADAMNQIASILSDSAKAQAASLEAAIKSLSECKQFKHEIWEFQVKRDAKGRMETVVATTLEKAR